jgi:hypothetical protein
MNRQLLTTAGATLALAVVAVAAAPASSAAESKRSGSCTAGSMWEADAEHDDGAIEVDWEVKTHQVGQQWTATIWHNGTRVLQQTGLTTRDRDHGFRASVDWDVDRPDRAGTDRFVLRAQNTRTGEVCRAELAL